MIYRVWDKSFYESESRFFAHNHEKHGKFNVENEADLKAQLTKKGINPDECRWELEI